MVTFFFRFRQQNWLAFGRDHHISEIKEVSSISSIMYVKFNIEQKKLTNVTLRNDNIT